MCSYLYSEIYAAACANGGFVQNKNAVEEAVCGFFRGLLVCWRWEWMMGTRCPELCDSQRFPVRLRPSDLWVWRTTNNLPDTQKPFCHIMYLLLIFHHFSSLSFLLLVESRYLWLKEMLPSLICDIASKKAAVSCQKVSESCLFVQSHFDHTYFCCLYFQT